MPNPAKRTLRVNQKVHHRNERFKRRVAESLKWPAEKVASRAERLTASTRVVKGVERPVVPLQNKLKRASASGREVRQLIISPEMSLDVYAKIKERATRARFLARYRQQKPSVLLTKLENLEKKAAFLERALARQRELDQKLPPRTYPREYHRVKRQLDWVCEQIQLLNRINDHQSKTSIGKNKQEL